MEGILLVTLPFGYSCTGKQGDCAVHSRKVSSCTEVLWTVTIMLGERNTIAVSSDTLSDQLKFSISAFMAQAGHHRLHTANVDCMGCTWGHVSHHVISAPPVFRWRVYPHTKIYVSADSLYEFYLFMEDNIAINNTANKDSLILHILSIFRYILMRERWHYSDLLEGETNLGCNKPKHRSKEQTVLEEKPYTLSIAERYTFSQFLLHVLL